MKKNAIIWSVIALGLVGLIVGASVLYSNLSVEHKANNVVVFSSSETAEKDEADEENSKISDDITISDKETTTSTNSSGKDKNSSADKTSSQVKSSSKVAVNSKVETSSEAKTSSDETVEEDTSDKVYFFDFTVVDANGKEVKLSDFRGKPIVLNFWTSWCGYCKREMPDFEKAAKAYPNVNFVMVNATRDKKETIDKAKKYIEDSGLDLNFYFDVNKDAVEEYGIRSYPTTYFLDAKGNMISYSAGSLNYNSLVENIELAIEGY